MSESVRRLPSIAEAEARLMRAQAELKLAELRLERTSISLPYDGRVMGSDVEVGELVGPADEVGGPSSRLGIVYRPAALQVDVPIEPRDLEYLDPAIGRAARVTGQMAAWEARVDRVSSVVAPRTRLASVFLKFAADADPDSLPAPGTFVEVDIDGPVYEDVYVLPESVLQERDSVWVVREGLLAAFAPKTLGRTATGWVVQAFDAGEGVVVGVPSGAREGLAVTVTDADAVVGLKESPNMTTTDPEGTLQPAAGARKGLIGYFAGNPVAANLLMLVLIAGGIASGFRLAVQNYPEIDLRMIAVTVRSPGSSAQEVEQDVNRRVEESVLGLAGVERVVATATEGRGRIRVELATFADAGAVLSDVRNAVDAIENFPPLNAEQPEIRLATVAIEAMTLAVSSPVAGENELRLAAEHVRSALLELPSVSQVTLRGTRDREIAIELSEEELRRNDLSIVEVSNAVQRASLNLTFGELRTESGGRCSDSAPWVRV